MEGVWSGIVSGRDSGTEFTGSIVRDEKMQLFGRGVC